MYGIHIKTAQSIKKLQVLTSVYNSEINFFPKDQSKQPSNFPFIDNLKNPACASKQNGLVLATLQYAFLTSFFFFSCLEISQV